MNPDEREEIAASVAAHAELGPRYEDAVAEGLVERIGAEIDKRVDARLRGMGQHAGQPPQPATSHHPAPAHPAPPPVAQVPQAPPLAPQPPPTASVPARRGAGGMVVGAFLALGSMGLGLGATAIVVSHVHTTIAAVFMIAVIWLAIMAINGENAKHR